MTIEGDWLKLTRLAWTLWSPSVVRGKKVGVDGMFLLHAMLNAVAKKDMEQYVYYCDFTAILQRVVKYVLELDACEPSTIYILFDGDTLPAKQGEVDRRRTADELAEAHQSMKELLKKGEPVDKADFELLRNYISHDLFLAVLDQLDKLRSDMKAGLVLEVAAYENDAHLANLFHRYQTHTKCFLVLTPLLTLALSD